MKFIHLDNIAFLGLFELNRVVRLFYIACRVQSYTPAVSIFIDTLEIKMPPAKEAFKTGGLL